MRKEFTLSQDQIDFFIASTRPVPVFDLTDSFPSPQERANKIWEKWGKEMGFDPNTVGVISNNTFTANIDGENK